MSTPEKKLNFRHYDDLETFDAIYRGYLQESSTNKEAYRKTEIRFRERFGKRRYSSYYSFKSAYSRRHKFSVN